MVEKKCCVGFLTISGEFRVSRYQPHPINSFPRIPYSLLLLAGMRPGPYHADGYTEAAYVSGQVQVTTQTICDSGGPECDPDGAGGGACEGHSADFKSSIRTSAERQQFRTMGPLYVPPPSLSAGLFVGAQTEWNKWVSFEFKRPYNLGCCSLPCPEKSKSKTHNITPYSFPWVFDREYWVNKNGDTVFERPVAGGVVRVVDGDDILFKYDEYAVSDAMGLTAVYSSNTQFDDILNNIISQYGVGGSTEAAEFEPCCSEPESSEPITGRVYQAGQ